MSLLCCTNCTGTDAPVSFFDLCNKIKRYAGGECLALIKCDVQIADIRDAAGVQALIDSGDIIATPVGKWELPQPTANILEEATGCGDDEIESYTYSIPFETPFAAEDGSDFKYFKSLLDSFSQYRAMLIGCDGLVYLSDDYFDDLSGATPTGTVLGASPGLKYSFSIPPYEERIGTAKTTVKWKFELKIENNGLLCAWPLPDVASLMCGC